MLTRLSNVENENIVLQQQNARLAQENVDLNDRLTEENAKLNDRLTQESTELYEAKHEITALKEDTRRLSDLSAQLTQENNRMAKRIDAFEQENSRLKAHLHQKSKHSAKFRRDLARALVA